MPVDDCRVAFHRQLRPVPEFNAAIARDHLLAIGAIEQRMLILVDVEKLMTSADTEEIHHFSRGPAPGAAGNRLRPRFRGEAKDEP